MQRTAIILACLFIYTNSVAQLPESHEQYPFVHYTPKDGLISNMIKKVYQDSKGRLYLTSIHGLSVYDGSRFTNYTQKNGLGLNIVNDIMEMGDDSIWVVTNSPQINCLVNGKMKTIDVKNMNIVINNLCKDEAGNLYATSEQGLYIFEKDHFTKLPFLDTSGNDLNFHLAYMFSVGDYLLIQRDFAMIPGNKNELYLYNKKTKKTTAEKAWIFNISEAPDKRIWVSTEKNIMALDTAQIRAGKLVLQELPDNFASLKNLGKYFVHFDNGNNCWLGNQSDILIKAGPEGNVTSFTPKSGLSMFYINHILQDREGITWIATNNAGMNKLVHSNFSLFERPYYVSPPFGDIFYDRSKDEWLLYSKRNASLVFVNSNKPVYYKVEKPVEFDRTVQTPYGIFAVGASNIYRLVKKNNVLYNEPVLPGVPNNDNGYSQPLVDKNGNLIACGKDNICAVINGKSICKKKLAYYADLAVSDTKGNVWVATRSGHITMFELNADDPSNYLVEKLYYHEELNGLSPRSSVFDKNDNLWIGTRSHGIHIFNLQDGKLVKKLSITTASGLSDDFTYHLACDADNNIWASSSLGLDKIKIKDGVPVVENLTRQNNIYQSVFKIVIDKNNTAWGTVSNGIIKITPEKERIPAYSPTLIVSMIKVGKDTVPALNKTSLSYRQSNLSFYFAATSFLDEKQIMYSYRLQGGSNKQWSEPSNNSFVSFIDLRPGDYNLEIKATFPASRYPEKLISYQFTITPPWWQTWWFRSIAILAIIGLLILISRIYYRRKLEKQMATLEKQQAIEKERTRIATDMHDDLGAGLSRIKFLSETIGIKKQQQQPVEEEVTKIREYSHEMIDKMGEIVWALNQKNDTLSDLLSYTRSYTVEYLSQNGINCKVEAPEQFPAGFVSGEFRRNVYLTVKETLHNIVKHAQATEVVMGININHDLRITINDNGNGFDMTKVRPFSNGLNNMKERINELNGRFEIKTDRGTQVSFSVPLP